VRSILEVAIIASIGAFGAVLLAEWMAGCGETYTTAKGTVRKNECLFIGAR
jgi:hypothetical protein